MPLGVFAIQEMKNMYNIIGINFIYNVNNLKPAMFKRIAHDGPLQSLGGAIPKEFKHIRC